MQTIPSPLRINSAGKNDTCLARFLMSIAPYECHSDPPDTLLLTFTTHITTTTTTTDTQVHVTDR